MPKGKPMSTRRLINNDYSFGNSQADMITGLDECLQKCKTILMQLRGEWFLDSRDGVPWGDALGQRTDTQLLTETIKKTLLGIDTVTSVDAISVDMGERQALVIANINTVYGNINLTQSLNILELIENDAIN